MVKKMNFNYICRFCMGTNNLNPLFNDKNDVNNYSMLIYLTTGIKIDSNDGLPQNICKTCILFINKSIKFRLLCKKTAKKLLNIKNKINRKSIKEEDSNRSDQKYENSDGVMQKCVLLTNDINFESNENYKSCSNLENSGLNIYNTFDNNFIKIDIEFCDKTIITGESNRNSKSESTANDNHDIENHNQTSYNDDNQFEIKFYDHGKSYNHRGTEKDNYNVNDSNNGISYHHDINSVQPCSHTDSNNEISNDDKLTKLKAYNHDESHNEKLYNNNVNEKLPNQLCTGNETYNEVLNNSIPSDEAKSHNYNEKSSSPKKSTDKIDPKSNYMIITKNNRVICKICSKNLALRSFDAHIWKCHPGVDERKILCSLCNEYIAKNRMKTHMEKHGNNFKCVYCNNNHGNKELLIEHTASCCQKTKKRKSCETSKELTECDVCHKMMQKGSLRLHKEVKHAGLGPICEHCNKKFSNKFRLMEHLRAKHGYDKFKCKLCEFETASEISLKNHERRHAGIKPYLCERCGAKFHAAYLLAQHRNTHTNDKIYKCEQCPASFKTNNGLHMHRMTCHSNKSLNCSICAKAYNCRHYLVKHMRGVHRYSGPIPGLGGTMTY